VTVYLSSFFGGGEGPRFSVARWAPHKFSGDHRTLSFLGAYGRNGRALQHLGPEQFRDEYYSYLVTQAFGELHIWLLSLRPDKDLTLCCWCVPSRQAQYPTLYCHRILIGHIIEEYRPDIPVVYTDGAENPVWTDNCAREYFRDLFE